MNPVAILGLTALAGFGFAATVRARLGFWAIPMVGRRPFIVVFVAFWALTAVGFWLAQLAPKSAPGVLAVIIASLSGVMVALRGRAIEKAGGRDPSRRVRPWIVALHAIFVLFVIVLMVTHQI
jgi:hypothetical protein